MWRVSLFILLIPSLVNATTYTVAKTGANAATCVTDPPTTDCLTIQYVFSNTDLAPGDIVDVRAGTYVENVLFGADDGGDSSSQVTLRGHVGETVTISGAGGIGIDSAAEGLEYITLQNLTVYDSSPSINFDGGLGLQKEGFIVTDITCDCNGRGSCIFTRNRVNSSFTDVTVGNCISYAFFIGPSGGVAPALTGNTIGDFTITGGGVSSSDGAIHAEDQINFTIDGDITINGTDAGTRAMTFENLSGTFNLTSGSTITIDSAGASSLSIRDSTATVNWDGRYISTSSAVHGIFLLDNTFAAGSYMNRVESTAATQYGIYIENSTDMEFKSFYVTTSTLAGISLNGAAVDDIVFTSDLSLGYSASEIYDNDGDGFSVSGNVIDYLLERTIISYNGPGVCGVGCTAGDGVTGHAGSTGTVRFNLIHDNDNTCFAYTDTSTLYFYNNTCVNNGLTGSPRGQAYGAENAVVTFKNNIFTGTCEYMVYLKPGAGVVTWTGDYNLFDSTDARVDFATLDDEATTLSTLAAYKTATSGDANSIDSAALLEADYTIPARSPARNAGTPNGATPYSEVIYDYGGQIITDASGDALATFGNRIDMGANEYLTIGSPWYFFRR